VNKVFTILWANDINAGAVVGNQAFVNNNNRQWKLKSIFFDLNFREQVSNIVLPLETNTVLDYNLDIVSQPAATMIGTAFENCTPAGNVAANGGQISLYRPGQLFFDSFFIVNQLLIIFSIINRAAIVYRYNGICTLEIEEVKLRLAK